jgi:hypothetical protein
MPRKAAPGARCPVPGGDGGTSLDQSASRRPYRAGHRAPGTGHRLLGPGLVLTLIASVIVWRQFPPAGSGPLRIERSRLNAVPNPPATPDPAWLLEQQGMLGLNAAQVRQLSRLRRRWDHDTRALREALAHASAEFEQGMRADGGRGQSIEQLQERAAPVSQLSRQLSDARRAW